MYLQKKLGAKCRIWNGDSNKRQSVDCITHSAVRYSKCFAFHSGEEYSVSMPLSSSSCPGSQAVLITWRPFGWPKLQICCHARSPTVWRASFPILAQIAWCYRMGHRTMQIRPLQNPAVEPNIVCDRAFSMNSTPLRSAHVRGFSYYKSSGTSNAVLNLKALQRYHRVRNANKIEIQMTHTI